MPRPALLLLPLFLLTVPATAQPKEKKQWNPFLVFDSYYSFIGSRSADVWGFRAGIEWDRTWRFGAGYNKLSSDIIEKKVLPSEELPYASNDTVKAQLYLRYFPLMAEYIAYREDPWQISLPLQLGYGQSYFEYFDRQNDSRKIFRRGVLVSQAGVNAQYKIIKWVGLTAGVGYRLMLVNNREIETTMNSPVFAIGIRLFLGEVVRSIRDKE